MDNPCVKAFTVGALAVKAYLIGCIETKKAFIIDPAGSEEMLVKEASNAGFDLIAIVNTHGHPDHTSGNRRMKELTGAPVYMHEADDRLFRDPEVAAMFQAWGFSTAPPADAFLVPDAVFEVGTLSFKVIHTPGHSPGSVCLYGHGVVVTGDTLFVGAAGRTDLPGGSFDTLIESLKRGIYPLPDETVVLPGHDYGPSPTSTIGSEKQSNPYLSEYCR